MKNNNFLDFLTYIYIYISWDCFETERNSAMNYSRRYLDHENTGQLFFFFFPLYLYSLFSWDVKLKNRTTSRTREEVWNFREFELLPSTCNCRNTRGEEYWNPYGVARETSVSHACVFHLHSWVLLTYVPNATPSCHVPLLNFLRFLPFDLPRII